MSTRFGNNLPPAAPAGAWGETLPRMSFDFNPAIRPKRKRKRNARRTQRRR
jgi:hypothetical protein